MGTLTFPFPAVIWLIIAFRCSRKTTPFLEKLPSLNFHEETSVWKQLWDAIACTPTIMAAFQQCFWVSGMTKPPRWINLLRKRMCYKWATSAWTALTFQHNSVSPPELACVSTAMERYSLLCLKVTNQTGAFTKIGLMNSTPMKYCTCFQHWSFSWQSCPLLSYVGWLGHALFNDSSLRVLDIMCKIFYIYPFQCAVKEWVMLQI